MSLLQIKTLEIPVEVIDMIVNWLRRRSDLLSLALSHSKFYQVVVPDHLHYRQADFCVFDYLMWNYLLEDPRRLGKLEVLNLSAGYQARAPPIPSLSGNETDIHNDADKVNSELVHNAFKGTRMLHTVIWNSNDAVEGPHRAMSLQISLWEAINRYCPTVQRVDALGYYNCWRCLADSNREATCPLENLSQISAFTLQIKCFWHVGPVDTYFSYLSSFQRLQRLTLLEPNVFPANIHHILAMKFPLLEFFNARDYTGAVGMSTMLAFLAAHPLLHTFIWTTYYSILVSDPLNTSGIATFDITPQLERLVSPLNLVQALFSPSSDGSGVRRPLRSLCTRLPLDTRAPPEDLALLSGIGLDLEELTVGDKPGTVKWSCPDLGAALRMVSSAFPNLRLLDLGPVSINECPVSARGPRPKVHDWMSALSGFSYLAVLSIPWSQAKKNGLVVQLSPSKRRHQTMEHFLARCPRLRFLFCRHWQITPPGQDIAILIGNNDPDVRFRKARLIDEGSSGDRRWAAYEGTQNDLDEEISMAVKARN
ncbi:hypothetical protein FRC04_005131 [Tulasnella sp. 424]|nr:hypothetical protein FRC04_005131 [Tulasnella sp. 424]KAG8972188.1 hypothetical protein FRC05_010237 [Tulasnella sp. 425]